MRSIGVVGEHSCLLWSLVARPGGASRRENVGMSNHNDGEKPSRRKTKVSSAMAINGGLGDPKSMAKAADEGLAVNIPRHLYNSMEGRRT